MKVPKIRRKKPEPIPLLDTGTGESVTPEEVPPTWMSVMEPNIRKFEVAAKFDGVASWNAEGSKAMAFLLRKMCSIIDQEVKDRGQDKHPPR